jgi:hypothetical protein
MLHERFPTVPLPLICQVLDFHRDNQAKVDAYVARKRSALERLEASMPPSPAVLRLRRKLEEMRRTEAP